MPITSDAQKPADPKDAAKVGAFGEPRRIEVARLELTEQLADQNVDVGLGETEDGEDALVLYPRTGDAPSMKDFKGIPVVVGADQLADRQNGGQQNDQK